MQIKTCDEPWWFVSRSHKRPKTKIMETNQANQKEEEKQQLMPDPSPDESEGNRHGVIKSWEPRIKKEEPNKHMSASERERERNLEIQYS